MRNICSVSDCGKFVKTRGLCSMHLSRVQRHGDLGARRPTPEERIFGHFKPRDPGECWPWEGSMGRFGYGSAWIGGRRFPAHVAVYRLLGNEIPVGLHLDHRCHIPSECSLSETCPHRRCVNPSHLLPVTPKENILRSNGRGAKNAAKTHCPQGHEYTPENTYYVPPKGLRVCRECDRRKAREFALLNRTHCKYGHEFLPETTSRMKDGKRICLVCPQRRGRKKVTETDC